MTNRAQTLRRNSTDAERALWRALQRRQLGRRFRRQLPIGPYIVDFACVEARLIVEVDGGQHAAPGDHDRRDAFLLSKGYQILRFWNNEVLQNRDGVLQRIVEMLDLPPPASVSAADYAERIPDN